MFSFFGGGLGATPGSDGLSHGNNPISMATIPPVEILEASYPVMFTQWALRPDSAGAGRWRGGLGAIYEIEALAESGADVFLLGERGKFAPFGVDGRRRGGAQPVRVRYARGPAQAAARLEDRRREDQQRRARAAGDARRRRLRAARASATRRRSRAT